MFGALNVGILTELTNTVWYELDGYTSSEPFENPKVSVVIQCNDTGNVLWNCLTSLIKQTLKEIEIICINNRYKDATCDLLSACSWADKRIKIVNPENQIQSISINDALKIAKGEYITFIDTKVILKENCLELLYSAIKKHNVNIAVTSELTNYKDKVKNYLKLHKETVFYDTCKIIKCMKDNQATLVKLYKSEFVKDLKFDKDESLEDTLCAINTIQKFGSMVKVPYTQFRHAADYNQYTNDSKRKIIKFLGFKISLKIKKNNANNIPNIVPFDKIRLVEIEIFSYCNRKCWFCPNSFVDRQSKNILMDEDLYLKILSELKSINYSNVISYSRYNEPLSHPEIFAERLQQAKEYLPNATLHTNTNGDYLTREVLDKVYDAGLRSMNIQCYLTIDETFDIDNIKKKIEQKAKALDLEYDEIHNSQDRYEVKFKYKNDMRLRMYARNFKVNGNNRAGSLDTIKSRKRACPCYVPFLDIYIDYNGLLMPCCNFRSDITEHHNFILGDANKDSILTIFNNEKSQFIRKQLNTHKINFYPCNECNFAEGMEY